MSRVAARGSAIDGQGVETRDRSRTRRAGGLCRGTSAACYRKHDDASSKSDDQPRAATEESKCEDHSAAEEPYRSDGGKLDVVQAAGQGGGRTVGQQGETDGDWIDAVKGDEDRGIEHRSGVDGNSEDSEQDLLSEAADRGNDNARSRAGANRDDGGGG